MVKKSLLSNSSSFLLLVDFRQDLTRIAQQAFVTAPEEPALVVILIAALAVSSAFYQSSDMMETAQSQKIIFNFFLWKTGMCFLMVLIFSSLVCDPAPSSAWFLFSLLFRVLSGSFLYQCPFSCSRPSTSPYTGYTQRTQVLFLNSGMSPDSPSTAFASANR